jgi:endonuclease/exonuclease/phosphatase (EEP) superfamily protein YafD
MRSWITARLVTLARVYFTLLFAWAILHALFGDRWWWLFLPNSFAVYLFLPLPAILVIALLARRRETWLGFGVALALGAYLFGGLFLPKFQPTRLATPIVAAGRQARASDAMLTVMTYNLLGFNENREGIVAALRASNADVIALQELNPPVAESIQRELAREYPYQALDPQFGVDGLGVISRYLLHPTDQNLPGANWVGTPQVLELDWNGTSVMLLHFHPFPTNLNGAANMEWSVRIREQQARAVADFVVEHPKPLIAPVDFNANDQSTAYAIVTSVLVDSWREAGWGLGHTFPGAASSGSSRPVIAGIPVPMWMARIDYVFHSYHWRATSAWIGPWDGVSDHRPVVARLALTR